jgi:hypothetical protein
MLGRSKLKWLLTFLLLNLSVFAQQASVPVIDHTSVPNFLKLPPDMYLGEMAGVAVNSQGHVFALTRGNTTGPAYGAAASQLLEFGPTASSSARSATTCTHGRLAIR